MLAGCLFLITSLQAQPAPRFEPFDWVLYTRAGILQSFSEGYEYLYIATRSGGIYRWHILRKQFVEPITTAQGLTSNSCDAVFIDRDSGILWVATPEYLEFSYDAEGNWIHRSFEEMGLVPGTRVDQIGVSKNYLWLLTGSVAVKIDRVSGSYLGQKSQPDEPVVAVGSGHRFNYNVPEQLRDYSVMDGWMFNGNDVIDWDGRTEHITTFYFGRYNDQFVGTDRGTLLVGDGILKSFQPVRVGLLNGGVGDLVLGSDILLGGSNTTDPMGLTWFNPDQNKYDYLESELEINSPGQPVTRLDRYAQDIWVGGTDIAVYHMKDQFWKTLGQPLQGGPVIAMVNGGGYQWITTNRELIKIDTTRDRILSFNVLPNTLNSQVYGLGYQAGVVWVVTDLNLLTVDPETDNIRDASIHPDVGIAPGLIRYEALVTKNSQMLLATSQGLFFRANPNAKWKLVLNPTLYGALPVKSMDWEGNYGVLNLGSRFVLFSFDGNMTRDYNYDFIGKINCAYIDGDDVWLGTNRGLIRFNWRNERLK